MSKTTPVFEPFNGGLVTARDPAALREGELTQADNSIYLPNDQSINKVKGRTKFVTAALAAIKGLRYLEFDDFTNQLVAYASNMYYRADMSTSETGAASFTAVLSNITNALTSGTVAGGPIITTTTTDGFANVRIGYAVSSSGGQIQANTTVSAIISTTSVQLSLVLTGTITSGVDTITFTPSIGTGATLESVQYNNRQYMLNGSANYVIETVSSAALITRPHGLGPVTEISTLAKVTGHWAQSLGIGYWFVITTEVIYPDSKNEIESTNTLPNSRVPYVQLLAADISSSTGKSIEVTRPTTIVNSNATHWRVYTAVNRDAPTCPPISTFQLMAQQQIGTTKTLIGDVTLKETKFPTVLDSSVSFVAPNFATNASDGKCAVTEISGDSIRLDTCLFAAISDAVSGIEVTLKMLFIGYILNANLAKTVSVDVQLAYGASNSLTISQQKVVVAKGITTQSLTFGGNTDTWGRDYTTWGASSGADITSANFGVKVVVNRVGDSPMTTCYLDSAEIRVYTNPVTSTVTSYGKYFPVVVASLGGVVSVVGANDLPPVASTGDIFDSQLVLNDVSDSSIIRYSLPDKVEYFPPFYFINFETKHTDKVVNIARLNNVLVVGLKNSIYRVNYLPRQEDAEFDRGRCYEPIAEDIGMVGTQAACNITLANGGIIRSFVSYNGVHITDGNGFDTWSDDIDFKALVSTPASASGTDYLKNCILVNYPINYQLWFFYTPLGGTANTAAIVFHYHPSHIKPNGKPKITGPITVNAGAATFGKITDMPILITGGDTSDALGQVFIEDRGYVDNSVSGTPNVSNFNVRTREMYHAGLGRAVTVNTGFVRHRSDSTSTIKVTPRSRFGSEAMATVTNDDGNSGKTFTTTNGGAAEVPFSFNAESMDFTLTEPATIGANQIRLLGIALEVVDSGLSVRRS